MSDAVRFGSLSDEEKSPKDDESEESILLLSFIGGPTCATEKITENKESETTK